MIIKLKIIIKMYYQMYLKLIILQHNFQKVKFNEYLHYKLITFLLFIMKMMSKMLLY